MKQGPIDVEAEKGRPASFRVGRRTYQVRRVISTWVVEGRWWAMEVRRRYFVVLTDRGTAELCRAADEWTLVKFID